MKKLTSYIVYGLNLAVNPIGGIAGLGGRIVEDTGLVEEKNKYLNLVRTGMALFSGLATIGGVTELANLQTNPYQILETMGQASLCWRFLADSKYVKNPKQFGIDIKEIFK